LGDFASSIEIIAGWRRAASIASMAPRRYMDQLGRVGSKTSAFQIGVVDSVGHA